MKLAVVEYKGECSRQATLNLHAALPPPAEDVDAIAILGEQIRIGYGVVVIPSSLLIGLNATNACVVVGGSSGRHSTEYQRAHQSLHISPRPLQEPND